MACPVSCMQIGFWFIKNFCPKKNKPSNPVNDQFKYSYKVLVLNSIVYLLGDFPSTNGLIAPGMSYPVTVKFCPTTLEDYDDKLEVLFFNCLLDSLVDCVIVYKLALSAGLSSSQSQLYSSL